MFERYTNSAEQQERATDEARTLSEVDHLINYRSSLDGAFSNYAQQEVFTNLVTAVKEGSIPNAVSTTYQPMISGMYMWLGQSPPEVAATGYKYHKHPAAYERVGVEIEEAYDIQDNLEPGIVKVMLSPRMSPTDAPYEAAKDEHLADDDMIRIHSIDADEKGTVRGKYMQSLLVRDVPLSAWVAMLRDPNNIFKKSVHVEDENSALSVMKTHQELSVAIDDLPDGVISILEAVIPYVDEETRSLIEYQLELFKLDQAGLHEVAENEAARWLEFEKNLAISLSDGFANEAVVDFIERFVDFWGEDFLEELNDRTTIMGKIVMTRQVALTLEKARRNTLSGRVGVITGNERVINQLDEDTLQRIHDNEVIIQTMAVSGYSEVEINRVVAKNDKLVASKNIQTGGGCVGEVSQLFGNKDKKDSDSLDPLNPNNTDSDDSSERNWKLKNGTCVVRSCPTRPGKVLVGPCGVCIGRCQAIYDNGGDPNKTVLAVATSSEPNDDFKPAKGMLPIEPRRWFSKPDEEASTDQLQSAAA